MFHISLDNAVVTKMTKRCKVYFSVFQAEESSGDGLEFCAFPYSSI